MAKHGFVVERLVGGPVTQPTEKTRLAPSFVKIRCVASAEVVGAVAGSDVVEIDFANYVDGSVPRVKKAATANGPVLGVVDWDAGTVATGGTVHVWVYGRHPYAKVDGSSVNVAAGDMLAGNGSGKFVKTTDHGNRTGRAVEAETADAVAAVWLADPSGILAF